MIILIKERRLRKLKFISSMMMKLKFYSVFTYKHGSFKKGIDKKAD